MLPLKNFIAQILPKPPPETIDVSRFKPVQAQAPDLAAFYVLDDEMTTGTETLSEPPWKILVAEDTPTNKLPNGMPKETRTVSISLDSYIYHW